MSQFSTLLDSVIANTEASRKSGDLFAVNDDIGGINWVNGLNDPGEMIACGAYQELRRADGETDEAYAQRITPILAALPQSVQDTIRGAAIKRANLDTTGGKVAVFTVVGPNGEKLPWHRLGTMVREAVNSKHARELAGLNWPVLKLPLSYTHNGKALASPEAFAIVRADSGAQLGTVGTRYEPLQNEDAFGFLDDLLGEHGARYESAGAIDGGKRVWMLAHLPRNAFDVQPGDTVEPYVMFSSSHDGTCVNRVFPTTVRTECANTYRVACNEGRGKGLSIRHTGDIKGKIRDARKALGMAVEKFADFQDSAAAMVRATVDPKQFIASVLDCVLEVTEAQQMAGANALAATLKATEANRKYDELVKIAEKRIETRRAWKTDIMRRYESARCTPSGSVWAAFNAVTESADYNKVRRYTGESKESRKFESVLTGDMDEMKQAAYSQAVAAMR